MTQPSLFDPARPPDAVVGAALRDQGILHVWDSTSDEWKARALSTIAELAASGMEFTSEDVRARAGDPPKPNAMGAAFQLAARRSVITKVGYVKATRPSLHASELAVWVGGAKARKQVPGDGPEMVKLHA